MVLFLSLSQTFGSEHLSCFLTFLLLHKQSLVESPVLQLYDYVDLDHLIGNKLGE